MKPSAFALRSALYFLAMAAGACAMYLLDPQTGRPRRAALLDNVFNGILSAGAVARSIQRIGDEALLERVRTRLQEIVAQPGLLSVTAHEGRVIVNGPVLSGETETIEQALRRLGSVAGLQLSLSEYDSVSDMPGLQAQRIWEKQYR